MKKKLSYTIGLDLGGTKLAAGFVRSDGKVLDFVKVPVEMTKEKSARQTQQRIVRTIGDIVETFRQKYPSECKPSSFRGVGLASAGPMNVESGELIHPANYPGWKKVPLRQMVSEELVRRKFKTEVSFQNDAMAAAFAEGWIGHAKIFSSFAVVTVGTGIGSGVILNGRPCQSRGSGSEFGHSLVDFRNFSLRPDQLHESTVEGIASGTALLRRARSLGFDGESLEDLIQSKDSRYQVLFDDMSVALAALCFNLSIGFHLDAIFISGGLIKIRDRYLAATRQHYKKMIRQFNPLFECPIQIAKTKNLAGVIGAAFLPYSQR